MMTTDNKMVFNEIIVYVFVALFGVSTALVGWVAVQTVEQIKISTAIQEHNRAMDSMMAGANNQLHEQSEAINGIKLQMATHGWATK